MTLADLEGELIRLVTPKGWMRVDTLEEASGVMFLCPGCYAKNGGPVGTHSVICWFAGRGVPDEMKPGPARWAASGHTIESLTLAPSVDVGDDHCWHGFVRDGAIVTC
jgi:hypothetical protein